MKYCVLLALAASAVFTTLAWAQAQSPNKPLKADATPTTAPTDSTHAFLNNGVLPDVGPFAPGDATTPYLDLKDVHGSSWRTSYNSLAADPRATTDGRNPYSVDQRATTNGRMPFTAQMRNTASVSSPDSDPYTARSTPANATTGGISQAPASATVAPGH